MEKKLLKLHFDDGLGSQKIIKGFKKVGSVMGEEQLIYHFSKLVYKNFDELISDNINKIESFSLYCLLSDFVY